MKFEEALGRLENRTWGDLFGEPDMWGSSKIKDKMTFRQPVRRFLLRAGGGGRAVSHVGVINHLCHVNGNICTVAGLGSITTIVDERGKGYAHQLLDYVLAKLKEEGRAKYALAFCTEPLVKFFRGWDKVNGNVQVLQPSKKTISVKAPYVTMFKRLQNPVPDLPLVYEIWLESFPW